MCVPCCYLFSVICIWNLQTTTTTTKQPHHITYNTTILHTKLYYPLKSLFSIHALLYNFQYIFCLLCSQFSRIYLVFFREKYIITSLLFVHFNQFVERFELSQFYYCLVDLNTEINCQFCKKEIFSSCSWNKLKVNSLLCQCRGKFDGNWLLVKKRSLKNLLKCAIVFVGEVEKGRINKRVNYNR